MSHREAVSVKFTNGQHVNIGRTPFTLTMGGKVVAKRVQVGCAHFAYLNNIEEDSTGSCLGNIGA